MVDISDTVNELYTLIHNLRILNLNDISKKNVSHDNKIIDELYDVYQRISVDVAFSEKFYLKLIRDSDETIKLFGAIFLLMLKKCCFRAYLVLCKIKFFGKYSNNRLRAEIYLDSLKKREFNFSF